MASATLTAQECFEVFEGVDEIILFTGCNIFEKGKVAKTNFKTIFTTSCDILYTFMWIFNVYSETEHSETTLNNFSAEILALQATVKLYFLIINRSKIAAVINYGCDFIREFGINPSVKEIFDKYIGICNKWRPIILRIYIVNAISFWIICGMVALFTDGPFLPFAIYLPLIDYESPFGYGLNVAYYLIVSSFINLGFFTSEMLFVSTTIMAYGQTESIAVLCENLAAYLEEFGSNDIKEINHRLAEIIKTQQRHDKFMELQEDAFGLHSFGVIFFSLLLIAVTVFGVMLNGWITGIPICMHGLWQITSLCLIGGFYMIKVDQLQTRVNSVTWYNLPWRKQKMYTCIIYKTQLLKGPTGLSRFPLNFETMISVRIFASNCRLV
uniref:Odorant receptor n=1 Tax=Lutzomyia longipalpis TaxID=7200 RepID=A0A7G3AF47_LUTLO